MTTQAILGQGTLLQRGDGASPENFTTVAEVLSIDGPGLQADVVDVSHQSGTNRYRDKIQGLRTGGQITFQCNYIPGNATQNNASGILGDFANGTVRNWRLMFPSTPAASLIVAAFVQQASIEAPVDSQLKINGVLETTGAPTLP